MFPAATSIKRLVSKTLGGKKALILAAAAALSVPALAHADSRFDRGRDDRNGRVSDRRDDRRDNDRGRSGTKIDVDIRLGGGDRRPEYREREVRVWVPATYRTVVDRQWVEPVYRVETERVWVPAQYEDREVVYYDRGQRCTRIDRVLVRDGFYETHDRQVCVSEGHWENCERQELVSAGHYETHIEREKVPYRVDPLVVVNPGLGGLWRR
jgi:hypothetical protein